LLSVAYTVGDYDAFNAFEIVAEPQSQILVSSYLPPARNTLSLFDFFIIHPERIYGFSIQKEPQKELDNLIHAS
jgi:hypothetical protein